MSPKIWLNDFQIIFEGLFDLYKVGCVFPMVIVTILPHAEFGPNDHQEKHPTLQNHLVVRNCKTIISAFLNKKRHNCEDFYSEQNYFSMKIFSFGYFILFNSFSRVRISRIVYLVGVNIIVTVRFLLIVSNTTAQKHLQQLWNHL